MNAETWNHEWLHWLKLYDKKYDYLSSFVLMKTEDHHCFYLARNVHTHTLTLLCVHASAGHVFSVCCARVTLRRACVCWFTVRRGAAPLRDRGMWMGQDVCCSVRASPLLRLLYIRQVACRLEWCIAAKTQWGIRRRHGSPPGKGPRWVRSSSDDPKIRRYFPGEKPLSAHQRMRVKTHLYRSCRHLYTFVFTVNKKEQCVCVVFIKSTSKPQNMSRGVSATCSLLSEIDQRV